MHPSPQDVIEFVAAQTATHVSKISPTTRINYDLGVDGDDGVELLQTFSEKFAVDLSDLRSIYFGPEAAWNPFGLLRWLFLRAIGRSGEEISGLAPLPVSVLIESAREGRWVDASASCVS